MTKSSIALVGFTFLAACGAPPPETTSDGSSELRYVGTTSGGSGGGTTGGATPTPAPIVYGQWTPYTSDEDHPTKGICPQNELISMFHCTGNYCDNLEMYCQSSAATVTGQQYTAAPFSEEPVNYSICAEGYWVTAITCTGSYCDNVSFTCTQMKNATEKNCHWTQETSDEDAGIDFRRTSDGAPAFMKGASCTGRYCDNMSFYVCEI